MKAKAVLASLVGLVIVGLIVARTAQVGAQNQYATGIAERLRAQGVPVKHVNILSQDPYVVDIVLQSSSTDKYTTVDDNWYMTLARREANLAYRVSRRIDSYKLVVLNANDEVISSEQIYLYPEDLNQNLPPGRSSLGNQETAELIKGKLKLGDLSLDKLEVTQETAPGGTGQVLSIQVSAPNANEANKSSRIFFSSLRQLLETINRDSGTNIVLCHLRVVDHQSQVLLDYIRDLESGMTQLSSKGLDIGLSDGPVSEEEQLIPETTPTPFVAYPDP